MAYKKKGNRKKDLKYPRKEQKKNPNPPQGQQTAEATDKVKRESVLLFERVELLCVHEKGEEIWSGN